jgi:hypothetical protein
MERLPARERHPRGNMRRSPRGRRSRSGTALGGGSSSSFHETMVLAVEDVDLN